MQLGDSVFLGFKDGNFFNGIVISLSQTHATIDLDGEVRLHRLDKIKESFFFDDLVYVAETSGEELGF